ERHHHADDEAPDDVHGERARREAVVSEPLHDPGEPVAGDAAHEAAEGNEEEALRVCHRASSPSARTASTRARAALVLASSSATAASPSARWCWARCSARCAARCPSRSRSRTSRSRPRLLSRTRSSRSPVTRDALLRTRRSRYSRACRSTAARKLPGGRTVSSSQRSGERVVVESSSVKYNLLLARKPRSEDRRGGSSSDGPSPAAESRRRNALASSTKRWAVCWYIRSATGCSRQRHSSTSWRKIPWASVLPARQRDALVPRSVRRASRSCCCAPGSENATNCSWRLTDAR